MDRRHFLSAFAAAGLLGGCTTIRPALVAGQVGGACLPRVMVSPERVIRTIAGLRPYRPSGFVVRAEPLGGTLVVHNYGHGGGGITLSWGTASLATEIGLPAREGAVVVLGAGIAGLTTARLAQERGRQVTIYAAALPPDTTSNIAGGQIVPASVFEREHVDAAWLAQFEAACAFTWHRWQLLTGSDTGVRWLATYDEGTRPPSSPTMARFMAGREVLSAADSPFGRPVSRYQTMYVEVGRFLRYLTAEFLASGGRIVVRRFATPQDVAALPERLVFNCTGLGSHHLFDDAHLGPKRGQLAVLLPQAEIDYAYMLGGYMFPRADGILLGGTWEQGQWDAVTTPEGIARIMATHTRVNSQACMA
ncbi:FAD-dependent oxidoreductase [Croceibacterium sp. TMG7-5b_MA50]|uniref:FAD-dependent oxidoreductase n=1 Tax=Croceibacterium sp. TMG7-5b_MA50 TaxID=3121290 RepID=UPI0032222065